MNNELFINKKDAFATWGVRMGESFLESLYLPTSMKDVIENKSRLEDGKRVLLNNRKQEDRELTLVFDLEGISQSDYIAKYKSFITEITAGDVAINIPSLGIEVYHLYYLRASAFAMNTERTFSKISIKFNEPNPANRI